MKMNKKLIAIASAALVLTATVGIAPTMAYFTATSTASGMKQIAITGTKTEISEEGHDMIKVITVENKETVPCYTRVRVVLPTDVTATGSGEGWTNGNDGYYYYSGVVAVGGASSELTLEVDVDDETMMNYDGTYRNFNVIVVPESTKVLYDEDGTPLPADWEVEN